MQPNYRKSVRFDGMMLTVPTIYNQYSRFLSSRFQMSIDVQQAVPTIYNGWKSESQQVGSQFHRNASQVFCNRLTHTGNCLCVVFTTQYKYTAQTLNFTKYMYMCTCAEYIYKLLPSSLPSLSFHSQCEVIEERYCRMLRAGSALRSVKIVVL